MDNAITEFFDARKEAWLKKNLKSSMSDEDTKQLETQCENVFALENWLPNAAKRAGQISISTHPCTFSHPSSRKNKNGYATSIIASATRRNDGFLRSGNVSVAADALGNAAALDVYKFLTLTMSDGQNLIQHLEQDSTLAKRLFTLINADENQNYQALKSGFLAMTTPAGECVTSSKIKQVYFPVGSNPSDDSYHLLSILTPSGILFESRKRLDAMRFGDEIKIAREKKKTNQKHEGFKEIYNLTTIGFGGTKPQNISVLNNQNGGKAHMFMCIPPMLKNRNARFPKSNFFIQNLSYFQCKNLFNRLHKLYSRDDNNIQIRMLRDSYYRSLIDYIIEKMWQVRSVAIDQFREDSSHLPLAQQVWLCEQDRFIALRENTNDWLDAIIDSITAFLFHGYEKVLGMAAIKLSDAEYRQMRKIVLENKEALR